MHLTGCHDHSHAKDLAEMKGEAMRVTLLGLSCNLFLGTVQLASGTYCHSAALTSDAWHTLTDPLFLLVSFSGFRRCSACVASSSLLFDLLFGGVRKPFRALTWAGLPGRPHHLRLPVLNHMSKKEAASFPTGCSNASETPPTGRQQPLKPFEASLKAIKSH